MKKILSLILSLVLVLCVFSFKSVNNIYSNNKDQSDILDDIKNKNYILGIKKIELNNKNQDIESVKDINLNSKSFNLSDGTYLIDRGYGWVMGNDASFLDSGFANPGETIKIQRGKMFGTEHSIIAGASTGFDLKVVKLAVELAYEHTIANENDISAGFSMKAPANKNLYVKTYTTYRRFDMIKVQNGSLVGHSATYEANGTWAKRITYNMGETVDQNSLKEKVTRNVLGETEVIDIKNTISVKGLDYIKNLDILVNSSSKSLELVNRSNTKIHTGFFSNDYFSIKLLDEFGKEKVAMKMTGNDYSNDSKFNNFSKVPYSIGDIISIYHEEPFRLNISGPISGNQSNNKYQLYEITENGLKSISPTIDPGVYNIKLKQNPSDFFTRNYSGFGVVVSNDVDKYNNASKWEFIYDIYKGAYIIKNMETNKVLVNKYYSYLLPNALQAVDEPNDNSKYFKILDLGNNEVSMTNLATGLAITVGDNKTLSKPMPYSNLDNQKFILEKR